MLLKGLIENTMDMFVFCILKQTEQTDLLILWEIFRLAEMWIFTANILWNVRMFSNSVSTSRIKISSAESIYYTKTTKYTFIATFLIFNFRYMLHYDHNAVKEYICKQTQIMRLSELEPFWQWL